MTPASELTTSDDNRAAKAALIALICQERTLLFAGAGVAVPADYPTWAALIQGLETVCDGVGPGFVRDPVAIVQTPIKYADMIKDHIRRCTGDLARYTSYLVNVFSKGPRLQSIHRDLVAIPFRGYVTTNYDSTLETALALMEHQPADKTVIIAGGPGYLVREFHASLAHNRHERRVAHIHGHFRQPETIVLSESDYALAYGLTLPVAGPSAFALPALVQFLQVVLAGWSLVFIGFSLRDPQFDVFLEAASKRYGLWNSATHYALMPTTDAAAADDQHRAARLKAEFGIETVFYERLGPSHERLYDIVKEMRDACGAPLPDINARTIIGLRA